MKKILYIDACIKRKTNSRTEHLAQAYLSKMRTKSDYLLETIILENLQLKPLNEPRLERREANIQKNDFSDPIFDLAKAFKEADEIVIAAPYWDMSFPSSVKLYIENICIRNLTFHYNEKGIPCGLTNIKNVTYITTAGGYIGENNFGYNYIRGLFSTLFGIKEFTFICAEGLDIYGNDQNQILADAIIKINNHQ